MKKIDFNKHIWEGWTVGDFIADLEPQIQVIMDKGLKSAFMEDYCVPSFPVFCLINPDGYVEHARLPLPQTPDFMQIIRKKVADYRASHKQ